MNDFKVGDKVHRFYTAEPAFIYGPGQHREEGVVIHESFEWEGRSWVAVKWRHSQFPDLSAAESVRRSE